MSLLIGKVYLYEKEQPKLPLGFILSKTNVELLTRGLEALFTLDTIYPGIHMPQYLEAAINSKNLSYAI